MIFFRKQKKEQFLTYFLRPAHPDTKITHRQYKERKLQVNIPDEYRHKTLQQNGKLNPAICKKNKQTKEQTQNTTTKWNAN